MPYLFENTATLTMRSDFRVFAISFCLIIPVEVRIQGGKFRLFLGFQLAAKDLGHNRRSPREAQGIGELVANCLCPQPLVAKLPTKTQNTW